MNRTAIRVFALRYFIIEIKGAYEEGAQSETNREIGFKSLLMIRNASSLQMCAIDKFVFCCYELNM
jgi:hypothetical protein